ncbi:MAG TPA: DUF3299 domain-containing protein [Porticoccaceae bacterium]|nr:DUF3299 domain-containing protein [Porticoccaceae bacterium]
MESHLNSLKQLIIFLLFTLVLSAQASENPEQKKPAKSAAYTTIEWTDLIPQEDLDILLNPPSYITDIEDGSLDDDLGDLLTEDPNDPDMNRYQKALVSDKIKPEMDGASIRLPGFVVPLEFDEDQVITQFFLVPYFGACIHMPPPPPNQIVFVRYPKGLKLEALTYPIWLSGQLETALTESDIAIAAYAMETDSFEYYISE